MIRSVFCILLLSFNSIVVAQSVSDSAAYLTYIVNPRKTLIKFYYKTAKGARLASFNSLKTYAAGKGEILVFATNGGMFKPDHSPVGLYIEAGQQISPIDSTSGAGNFYLKPNGIFFLTKNGVAGITETALFKNKKIAYATQSGPMLIINGDIHPVFTASSGNRNIRNGVGILADGRVLFAMSERPVTFFEFADFFKSAGCRNALYLDGFVSRTYLPEKPRMESGDDFGVMIGVTDKKNP